MLSLSKAQNSSMSGPDTQEALEKNAVAQGHRQDAYICLGLRMGKNSPNK